MPSLFYRRLLLLLVVALAMSAAFVVGAIWDNHQETVVKPVEEVDLSSFWKVWNIIDNKFVDTSASSTESVSNQARVWGAVDGLVASLGDPYSDFLPPEESEIFAQDIKGEFGGIGIEIGVREDNLVVIAPLEGSPAKRAGLKAGDKIMGVDDTIVAAASVLEATNLIRGPVGESVKITILRGDEEETRDFKITREVIQVPTIETKLLPQNIFLIKLFNFGATSPDLFRQALRDFINSNTDKMIIDLRGNPGGYLDVAIDLASWFLPSGKVIAIEDRGDKGEQKVYHSQGYDVFTDKLKLVILIDGGSASASEILAGALSEHGRAKLIGQKTFGKGSVQELVPITDDSSLKITIARWLTPNGFSISHNGLMPDIVVDISDEKQGKAEVDIVLERAVTELLNWK